MAGVELATEQMLRNEIGRTDRNRQQIRGWLAVAGPWRSGRQHVTLFVNGRWVRTGTILAGLEAAYRPFTPPGKHPVALLSLDVPPSRVDPNVHPAKLEVRLSGEPEIVESLQEAVTRAFGRHPAGGVDLDGQLRLPLRRIGESPAEWDSGTTPDLRGLRLVAQAMDGGEHTRRREPGAVRRPGSCGPCDGGWTGSRDRRGSACADGSRAPCDGDGCSAGTYACSPEISVGRHWSGSGEPATDWWSCSTGTAHPRG